jgi:hypothetical protein
MGLLFATKRVEKVLRGQEIFVAELEKGGTPQYFSIRTEKQRQIVKC